MIPPFPNAAAAGPKPGEMQRGKEGNMNLDQEARKNRFTGHYYQAIIKGMSGAELKSPFYNEHKEAVAFISKWLGDGEDKGLMEERHEFAAIRSLQYENGLLQSDQTFYHYEW